MLSPLMQWRDPAVVPDGRANFRLDPGRIIVCKGEAGRRRFDALWKSGGEAGDGLLVEMKHGMQSFPSGAALFIRVLAGPESSALLAELEPQLEAHARDGGSVMIALGDELALPAMTQALLPPPSWNAESPRLLDDQGLALRYARQGDWVQLHWPLPAGALAGAETLTLQCSRGGDKWLSTPQPLAAWHPFAAGATAVVAELAIPWPPGSYRLRLELAGRGNKPPKFPVLLLQVKPSTVNPLPHEFTPAWRLLCINAVPAPLAGLSLAQPATHELELSPAASAALRGEWHPAERRADGGWRRWIGTFAQWSLCGSGELILDLEDHRVRGPDGSPTRLTLFLDGQVRERWNLERTGAHRLRTPWPDDGFAHFATLTIHPAWSPAEFGQPGDTRRLGVLINRCELSHE